MKRRTPAFVLAQGSALLLSGCSGLDGGFFAPLGPVAEAQRDHFVQIAAIVVIVLVPVFAGLPWLVWRYRLRAPRGEYRPNWEFSRPIEFAAWGVPLAIVIVLAAMLWGEAHRLDPWRTLGNGAKPLRIEAIGFDSTWLFLYPESGTASFQQLLLPARRPVDIEMTSAGVMQSLMIPRLAGQVYAMNGMRAHLNLLARRPGVIAGRNMQYDGNAFARQRFPVVILPPARFQAALHAGPAASLAGLRALACGTDTAPRLFSSAPAGLFGLFAAPKGRATDTARWCSGKVQGGGA